MHETPCQTSVANKTRIDIMEPEVGKIDARVRKIEIRTAFISGISASLLRLLSSRFLLPLFSNLDTTQLTTFY